MSPKWYLREGWLCEHRISSDMEDLATWVAIVSGIVTIAAAVKWRALIKGFPRTIWNGFRARVLGRIHIIAQSQACYWSLLNDGQVMSLHGEFHIRNGAPENVRVLTAHLSDPPRESRVWARLETGREGHAIAIPTEGFGELSVGFRVSPPVRKADEDYVASVVFKTDLGTAHRCSHVVFRPR